LKGGKKTGKKKTSLVIPSDNLAKGPTTERKSGGVGGNIEGEERESGATVPRPIRKNGVTVGEVGKKKRGKNTAQHKEKNGRTKGFFAVPCIGRGE